MSFKVLIVDDDPVCRRMLTQIIEGNEGGLVVGTAENGWEAISKVEVEQPEVVLIDLLMPDLDGIGTIKALKERGYLGKFVMLSQVVNKDMVGEAYQMGVEFFIHKPINRIEVTNVLQRVKEHMHLQRSLWAIRQSLSGLDSFSPPASSTPKHVTVRDVVVSILSDLGVVGESGGEEIIAMMEVLAKRQGNSLPPLKDLYDMMAMRTKSDPTEIAREGKAIEQRLRRLVLTSLSHLASLGLTDYTHPKFEHYATRYFDFHEVRLEMIRIEKEGDRSAKGKVNIKKFLQVFYLDMLEKMGR
ncbi:response regulator [Ammoniphilus sp. YIM 78166]|uniref:response regulator n=1 Tax=Ammoniphilus sp. YIM 78166 TaxID=1644106 RepID=UPI00107030AD|nr:response regulator [Ammoniphilus sp. YIM 78166]